MMEKLSEKITHPALTTFCGGNSGSWKVLSINCITGPTLEPVPKIERIQANYPVNDKGYRWFLRGVTSNLRYTTKSEKEILDKTPSILGKPQNTYAALIPIKKSDAWWLLTQDERRKIFEEDSRHIRYSLPYLPVISRKLYHSRDIGEDFDFLTWFEFTPENSTQFDELAGYLRQTEEWKFVIREVDIRLMWDEEHQETI